MVRYEDLTDFIKAIAGCDWFRPGLNGLHDWRDATIDLSDSDRARLTGYYSHVGDIFGSGRAVAIVADAAGRRLVETFAAARTKISRERFAVEDLPSALEALGLPADAEIEF